MRVIAYNVAMVKPVRKVTTTFRYCPPQPKPLENLRQPLIAGRCGHTGGQGDHSRVQMASLMAEYQRPVFGVSLLTDDLSQTDCQFGDLRFRGVVYPTPERAVKASARMVGYARWREQEVKRAG